MLNSVKTALLHGGVDPVPVHAFPVRTDRHSLVNSPALAALRTPPGAPRAPSSLFSLERTLLADVSAPLPGPKGNRAVGRWKAVTVTVDRDHVALPFS